MKKTFPFQNKREFSRFQQYFKKHYSGLRNIKNDEEFFIYAEKFVAGIRNSHVSITGGSARESYKPKKCHIIFVENKFFLRKNNELIGEILSVGGRKPINILNEAIESKFGSTKQWLTGQGLGSILLSTKETPVELKLKIDNKITNLVLERRPIIFIPFKEKNIESRIFNKNIGYLKIRSWKDKEKSEKILENKIKYFIKNKIKSLIIDVRDNTGGNSSIAEILMSHLFNKKTLLGTNKRRVSKTNFKLEKFYYNVSPQEPYLDIPIIILINSRCFSSNELFIAAMKDNKRALFIGEITGGGSGNPQKFNLPFKKTNIQVFISTHIYYRVNNKLIEGKGIRPHIFVKPTIKGLKNNRDEVLEGAIIEAKKLVLLTMSKRKDNGNGNV